MEAYFQLAVTTAESSRAVQRRDVGRFLAFMQAEVGHSQRPAWTPRLSRAFVNALRATLSEEGARRWSDSTINRILAHLKTFATWVHRQRPFPLGAPLANLAALSTPTVLALERALTLAEQRQLLDAADLLVEIGGRSRDRRAHGSGERPRRKGYRPYRNRAIVYTLLGTGMRRAAIRNLNLAAVDFERRLLTVTEKGGVQQTYHISRAALAAIGDYLAHERTGDAAGRSSPALFLAAASHGKGCGRLSVRSLNSIWTAIAQTAGVSGKTPHAARHAMGKRIMQRTGNVAAVQRQLGHRNASYALQYARPSFSEMEAAINEE
ncbi:MAG: tyrosine-type recombinase/integrase [Gemmatimonas sp.]